MKPPSDKPLCLVPARGGSKRLPRKNVAPFGGKPLLAWTIEAALEAGIFDTVWVSSENEEILRTAETWGGEPLPRPPALAGDRATEIDLCLHVLHELAARGHSYAALYMLLPTSPLRRSETIRRAWRTFEASGADALLSVIPLEYPPQWGLIEAAGGLRPWRPADYETHREDLQKVYRHDGGHAIVRVQKFLREPGFVGARTIAFPVPLEEAVDVNEPLDLLWAEFLLEKSLVGAGDPR